MPRKWKPLRHKRLRAQHVLVIHQCTLCDLLGTTAVEGVAGGERLRSSDRRRPGLAGT